VVTTVYNVVALSLLCNSEEHLRITVDMCDESNGYFSINFFIQYMQFIRVQFCDVKKSVCTKFI
jgi:hypothetical protein